MGVNNMKIHFLKQNSVYLLKEKDLKKNLKYYQNSSNSMLILKYKDQDLFAQYDKKDFPDFQLIINNDPSYDYQNMKIIYENLKELTDSQASDERIWSGLAHYHFWEYMKKRWPMPNETDKQIKHILNNYFFWNSTKAVFLNGLSRLWWYARYTYDETFDDPYELTKYICEHDINGKIFPLLSCKFAINKEVFKNIIKAVKEYEEENQIVLSRKQFNDLKSYLNRLSGKIVIDVLSYEELKDKIVKKIEILVKETDSEMITNKYFKIKKG